MPDLFYVVFVCLLALCLAVVAVIYALDLATARQKCGGYRSTWRQRRAWRKERREAGWQ